MATTFTKILIHFIFSTKNRAPLIASEIEPLLHAYMIGIARNYDCWSIAMNGTQDHVHMLVSLGKQITVSHLMEEVKGDSSRWMNKEHPQTQLFRWQEGYAALSIGESGVEALKAYIAHQKQHHQCKTFQEELLEILKKYGVPYDERYMWT